MVQTILANPVMSFALRRLHRWIQPPKKPQKQARLTLMALIRHLQTLISLHLPKLMNLVVRVGNYARKSPYLLSTTSYMILQQPGSSVGRAPGICPRGPGFKPQSGHFFSRSHNSQQFDEKPQSASAR